MSSKLINENLERNSQSTTLKIYNELKKSLILGDLKPGHKLKIDDLKKKYQTGTNPVRESLTLLISDALVEKIDQKGFRVSEASKERFDEILKTRIWAESFALEESMNNKKDLDKWEEELLLINYRLEKTERSSLYEPLNPSSWEMIHKKFHLTLVSRSGSRYLRTFCEQLYDQNMRYRFLLIKNKKNYKKRDINVEHKNILEAVLKRDTKKAKQLLIEHYKNTGSFLTFVS
jgi:GntR family transcriptional regulator, carbon starvation induced regulator